MGNPFQLNKEIGRCAMYVMSFLNKENNFSRKFSAGIRRATAQKKNW